MLHHAACFDGAASAALFAAFYRTCVSGHADFRFIPKPHRRGDPFEDSDFRADDTAIVDFRYTARPGLGWFFDHHRSSFQLPGEREHFRQDTSGRRFHDPSAPSCTGYLARVGRTRFGFDPSPYQELITWADIIDSANFASPTIPVELDRPPMRLMTFVEHNSDPELAQAFVADLEQIPLATLAEASYVRAVVEPATDRHRQDIELMRHRCRVHDGVGIYDFSDQPPRSYNKFIAYYLYPELRYLVGLSTGPDGRFKISVGYNPWMPRGEREHDIALLCERFGGGGHAYVGGVSFSPQDPLAAHRAHEFIASVLRGQKLDDGPH